MRSYDEIKDYLYQVPKFTKKNTYEDSRAFYEYIGSPGENKVYSPKIIHIAGTNGKGSVCAFLNQIYLTAGYKVGMFTSPHLICMEERIQVNGRQIDQEEFVHMFELLSERIEQYQEHNPGYRPTFFEFLFFMMMQYFQQEKVDVILLETGLGGRLDITNVIKHPQLCIVTKIGLDHTEYLGSTLKQIAMEKAGIIKRNVPVVFLHQNAEVEEAIYEVGKEKNAECISVDPNEAKIVSRGNKSIDFSLFSRYYSNVYFQVNSTAGYQVENALVAITAASFLRETLPLELTHVQQGIRDMKWPGRMEEILPGVFLDGAHNPDGIRASLASVSRDDGCDKILLFSAVKEKHHHEMIREFSERDDFSLVCITSIPGMRGSDSDFLKEEFLENTNAKVIIKEDVKEAFLLCINRMNEMPNKRKVYILGSLYLVGIIKEIIQNTKE